MVGELCMYHVLSAAGCVRILIFPSTAKNEVARVYPMTGGSETESLVTATLVHTWVRLACC